MPKMITLNPQTLSLSGPITADLALARERWRRDDLLPRLWRRDATVWTGGDEAKWLGWLTIVDREQADDLQAFASEVARDGFRDALVLGMGGSSLPNLKAEFSKANFGRGAIGAARGDDPNSANSQFFICYADCSFLNGQYTIWGQVVKGMENVDNFKKAPEGVPIDNPDKIIKMQIAADAK